MYKQASKLMVTILLSLATLIGCDCGKVRNKNNAPKKQVPQSDKNNLEEPPGGRRTNNLEEPPGSRRTNGKKPKQEQTENQAEGANKPSKMPSEKKDVSDESVSLDEVKKEVAEVIKEVKDIERKFDKLSDVAARDARWLYLTSTMIEYIKKEQANVQKYKGSTKEGEKELLENAQHDLKIGVDYVVLISNQIIKAQEIDQELDREIRKLKGIKEETFQDQDQELLKPLRMKVVKIFFKYVGEVVPIDIETLMKVTKLTREEIEALKPPK